MSHGDKLYRVLMHNGINLFAQVDTSPSDYARSFTDFKPFMDTATVIMIHGEEPLILVRGDDPAHKVALRLQSLYPVDQDVIVPPPGWYRKPEAAMQAARAIVEARHAKELEAFKL